MTQNKHADYIARDGILKLLSDDEIASVSVAQTAVKLSSGDEYIDLKHLDQGVRCAATAATAMGHVLPRKSVRADTWTKILTRLPADPAGAARSE